MPWLKPKTSTNFLAIKRYQQKKIVEVTNHQRSSLKSGRSWAPIPIAVKLLHNCMLSVDGTDFRLAIGCSKPFWSFKFKKSGMRYEVGLCIKTGEICWWNGPYELGDWNDNFWRGIDVDVGVWWEVWDRRRLSGQCTWVPKMSKRSLGLKLEYWHSAEGEEYAGNGERAVEQLGHFGNPFSPWFSAAPNSVCCSYCTSPAVLGIQPIVFSGIMIRRWLLLL